MTAKDEHLTVAELAKHWRVSEKIIRELCRARSIRAHRVGRLWRIAPEEVERAERERVV